MRGGGADASHFVGGDGGADACAADEDGALGFACGDGLGDGKGELRVAGVGGPIERAADAWVGGEAGLEGIFQFQAVGGGGDDEVHGLSFLGGMVGVGF